MAILDRAFSVIELLSRHREGLSLGAISEHLKYPKSSTHQLLNTLVSENYIERVAGGQTYILGMYLPSIAFRYLGEAGIQEVCQPILHDLAQQVGELAQLAVVAGDELTFILWSQGARSLFRYVPEHGRIVNLHATASGAAWLASLPETEVARIVARQGFGETRGRFTKRTLHTLPDLFEKLKTVRKMGYATSFQESNEEINAMAAPVRVSENGVSRVVATVGVAGPLFHINKQWVEENVHYLLQAAERLSAVWPIYAYLSKLENARNPRK